MASRKPLVLDAANLLAEMPAGDFVPVTAGGTGRVTGATAYGLVAAGTTATGAQQTLAAGATTELLVGGGSSALPVWTTATGSGAPVRATSPTLVTPALGTPTALVLTNATGLPLASVVGAGTAAAATIGTSGDTVPKNNTANTASAIQRIEAVGDTLTLASVLPRLVLEETDGSADAFFNLNNGLLYVGTSASTANRWFDITLSTGATRFGGAVTMVAGLAVTGAISATTTLESGGFTVATLPTGAAKKRAYVTDALGPTFGAAVVGGGAVGICVYHDGTSWKVG